MIVGNYGSSTSINVFTAIHGSVRFSLSTYNSDNDIDIVLEKMPKIIKELRDLSPFGREVSK